MAGVWIEVRTLKAKPGKRLKSSYRVRYRIGGREAATLWAGSFATRREAEERAGWVEREIAAMRVPDLQLMRPAPPVTLRDVAAGWQESRIDVSEGTRTTHRVNLDRVLPTLGDRRPDEIRKADVQELVARLHRDGLARESIRKTVSTLAQVLDHAEILPNPARRIRLPELDVEEVDPPAAGQVEAVVRLLPSAYRLPVLVLDACGMRVGELQALRWGDVDETEGRWRVAASSAKTRRARWVPVPEPVFAAVVELKPRDDRDLAGPVFEGFNADGLRTAISRACRAAGVPAFSPHDLRHRRATLWHLRLGRDERSIAEVAGWLGHSSAEHLKTYAHAQMVDRTELDCERLVRTLCAPSRTK